MNRLFLITSLLAASGAALAQPVVSNVSNSASYAYAGLPNAAIAQGSLFAVFGSGMGPSALQQTSGYPLTTSLAGTSLSVTVNGTTTKPFLIYTLDKQIGAILPSSTPVGSGTITVTYNGQSSAAAPIQVASSNFGIYTVNSAGSGPGIVTNAAYQVASLTSSANPGETFILWGTGLGPAVSGDESQSGATLALGSIPVEVYVGGKTATVPAYARSGCCSGVDQVAFVVPAGVTGCHVPVVVKINSTVSNFVSMPIAASGRTCSDPTGTTPVTTGGNVSIGDISLSRSAITLNLPPPIGNQTSTTDSGLAIFERYTPVQYAGAQNPLELNTFGACTVYTFQGNTTTPVDPITPTNLDAGPALTVTGPNGTKTLAKSMGLYSATLGGGIAGLPGSTPAPLYLDQGPYTVTGPGGTDVGPFSATLNVPAPLVWTNSANFATVNRAQPQDVTWTGGDPNGNVQIYGTSFNSGPPTVGAGFVCVERASAGHFTIPSVVLLSLPATSAAASFGLGGVMSVGYYITAPFKATGIDQGIVSASGSSGRSVTFQ